MNVALHTIECFAGVGMLGIGLHAGLRHMGIETRTVCYVEREAFAASVMAARMAEGTSRCNRLLGGNAKEKT